MDSIGISQPSFSPGPVVSPLVKELNDKSSTSQTDLHRFRYVRTGQGEECKEGLKVAFLIGHKPSGVCGALPTLAHHGCMKDTCPACYKPAIDKKARKVEKHLAGRVGLLGELGIQAGKPKHIVFSPAQDRRGTVYLGKGRKKRAWTRAELEADGGRHMLRQLEKNLAESFQGGFYLGTLIPHMERKKHKDGTECEKDGCLREHTWVWGPHVHAVVYGFILESEAFHAKTGWMYKRIRDKGERDIYETVRYQLSHSAHFSRTDSKGRGRFTQAYLLVGQASRTRGGQLKIGSFLEGQTCEKCQAPLHKFAPSESDPCKADFEIDLGPYQIKRDEKAPYLVRRSRNGLGTFKFIYPANLAERVRMRWAWDRDARAFKKEVARPLWRERHFAKGDEWGPLKDGPLFVRPEKLKRDRLSRWRVPAIMSRN